MKTANQSLQEKINKSSSTSNEQDVFVKVLNDMISDSVKEVYRTRRAEKFINPQAQKPQRGLMPA